MNTGEPEHPIGAKKGQEKIDRVLDSLLCHDPVQIEKREQGATRRKLAKRRKLKTGIVLVTLIIASTATVQTVWAWSQCGGPLDPNNSAVPKKSIALIDELQWQHANPEFVQSVRTSAMQNGYRFDYYPPNTATVDFFANLPRQGYAMIILRAHGSADLVPDNSPPAIATTELYAEYNHLNDQLLDRITTMNLNRTRVFAIAPSYITNDMCGRFPGTLILAMWCTGGQWTSLADAFVQKGARAYIGWNAPVTLPHTDQAFARLVGFLTSGNNVHTSVQNTMAETGPDPLTGARLIYFPA